MHGNALNNVFLCFSGRKKTKGFLKKKKNGPDISFLVFLSFKLKHVLISQMQRFSQVAHIFEKFELYLIVFVDVENHING